MLTLLANLKNYLLLGFGAAYVITFLIFETKLVVAHHELKTCNEKYEKVRQAILDQNDAVQQLQEDAYAKQEKLSIIEKKVNSDRIKSQKEAADLLSLHIPPGCNEAIKYGISQAQMGK